MFALSSSFTEDETTPSLGRLSLVRSSPGRPSPGRPSSARSSPGRPSLGRPSLGRPSLGRPSPGRPSPGRLSLGRPSPGRPSLGRPSREDHPWEDHHGMVYKTYIIWHPLNSLSFPLTVFMLPVGLRVILHQSQTRYCFWAFVLSWNSLQGL